MMGRVWEEDTNSDPPTAAEEEAAWEAREREKKNKAEGALAKEAAATTAAAAKEAAKIRLEAETKKKHVAQARTEKISADERKVGPDVKGPATEQIAAAFPPASPTVTKRTSTKTVTGRAPHSLDNAGVSKADPLCNDRSDAIPVAMEPAAELEIAIDTALERVGESLNRNIDDKDASGADAASEVTPDGRDVRHEKRDSSAAAFRLVKEETKDRKKREREEKRERTAAAVAKMSGSSKVSLDSTINGGATTFGSSTSPSSTIAKSEFDGLDAAMAAWYPASDARSNGNQPEDTGIAATNVSVFLTEHPSDDEIWLSDGGDGSDALGLYVIYCSTCNDTRPNAAAAASSSELRVALTYAGLVA